jgi:hypothetical protein
LQKFSITLECDDFVVVVVLVVVVYLLRNATTIVHARHLFKERSKPFM